MRRLSPQEEIVDRPGSQGTSYISLALILLGVAVALPLLYSGYLSLQQISIMRPGSEFVGLRNYTEILSSERFLVVISQTLFFAFVSTALTLLFGLLAAYVFSHNTPTIRALRRLFALPLFVAPVSAAVLFSLLTNPQVGLLGTAFAPVTPAGAQAAVILVDIWRWTPLVMIVMVAALHTVPRAELDAAWLETSSNLTLFQWVFLPRLRSALLGLALLRFVSTLGMFDIPYVLTAGGPALATTTTSLFAFEITFRRFDLGLGAAFNIVSVLLILPLVLALAFLIRRPRSAPSTLHTTLDALRRRGAAE